MNEQNINPGIFGLGNPNDAYSQYFSGRSWLKMLTVERLVTANVTFEAGCRNNWHVHHKGGQILLVTAGHGWYQAYGEPPRSLKPGRCCQYSAGSKALARCGKRFVFRPYCH